MQLTVQRIREIVREELAALNFKQPTATDLADGLLERIEKRSGFSAETEPKQLTEKEIHCIARHAFTFYESAKG